MTIHSRNGAGEPSSITFSEQGEPEGYRLEMVSIAGRSKGIVNVDLCFAVDGAKSVEMMQIINAEGVKVRDGVYVTHYISVQLPQEDAHWLSWQLTDFTNSAEHLVEGLTRRTPRLEDISYGGDYLAVHFNQYRTLKLGLTSKHRFTLCEFGRGVDVKEDGSSYITFSFHAEDGKEHRVAFSAPAVDVDRMDAELRAFLELYRRANPKLEIAK